MGMDMLTKEQLNILSVFKNDVFSSLTFKQIRQRSRQKSNNVVQIALREFKKEGLIDTKKIGNITTYFLDLNNLSIAYLNLINESDIRKSTTYHDFMVSTTSSIGIKVFRIDFLGD